MKIEEKRESNTFKKVVIKCNGKTKPIKKWFNIFERNADAYEVRDKQKYVEARNKLIGPAKVLKKMY